MRGNGIPTRLSLSLHVSPEISWEIITERGNFRLCGLSSGKCAHFSNYGQASFSLFTFHTTDTCTGIAETCTGGMR